MIRDITKRKKSGNKLMETTEFLDNILESIQDCVVVSDTSGYFTRVNKYFLDLLGYEEEEVLGKHVSEFTPHTEGTYESVAGGLVKINEEFFDDVKSMVSKLINERKISNWESYFVRKDKKVVPVEENVVYLYNGAGKRISVVGIVRDITERKQAEKRISDYQNQLRSLASQLVLTEERERRRIATDLHDRIGQALAISKIKLGALRESTSSIGLDSEVDEIRDLIEQTIQDTRSLIFDLCPPFLYELGFEKAVEWLLEDVQEQHGIATIFENDGSSELLGDDVRVLLYQTIRELLINIVKHAQAKNIKVSIKCGKNEMRISVKDDGIGFDISKIGYQMGKSGGFGLFRIRERLHYLGGKIQFESRTNHGTTVYLVVPLEKSNGGTRKEAIK